MLTARNSVHRSVAFGRNCFSQRTQRTSSSALVGPGVALELNEAAKPSVDLLSADIKQYTPSASSSGCTESVQNDTAATELSEKEKRKAKRRRQKELKEKQASASAELTDNSFLPHINTVVSDQRSTETYELPAEDAADSGLGDSSKSDTLGLAYVKSSLASSSTDLSELSEEVSLELDSEDRYNVKSERLEIGSGGKSPLEQQSSLTDSSGVETSSDADIEHPTFGVDSSESSIKDQNSDIMDDAFEECDVRDIDFHSLKDHQKWNQPEEEFTTVARKKKARLPLVNGSVEEEVGDTESLLCGIPSCQEQKNDRKTYPNTRYSKETASVEPLELKIGKNDSQNLENGKIRSNDSSSAHNSAGESKSLFADAISNEVGLSRLDYDDDVFETILKMSEDGWTTVKAGRRTKPSAQSAADSSKSAYKSIPGEAAKCLDDVVRPSSHTYHAKDTLSAKSAVGGQSFQRYRCNNSNGLNVKTFNRSRHGNTTQGRSVDNLSRGFSNNHGRRNFVTQSQSRDESNDSSNPNKLASQGIRLQQSGSTESKNTESVDSNRNVETRVLSVDPLSSACSEGSVSTNGPSLSRETSTDEKRTEKFDSSSARAGNVIFSGNNLPPAGRSHPKKDAKRGFDLRAAQLFLSSEFSKVMAEHEKNPHLVRYYNPEDN